LLCLPTAFTHGARLLDSSGYIQLTSHPAKSILIDLSIATSVDVERLFSCGCAILCLGDWSLLDMISNKDLKVVAAMPDTEADEVMPDGWDNI
jgi:hypothetical protein